MYGRTLYKTYKQGCGLILIGSFYCSVDKGQKIFAIKKVITAESGLDLGESDSYVHLTETIVFRVTRERIERATQEV